MGKHIDSIEFYFKMEFVYFSYLGIGGMKYLLICFRTTSKEAKRMVCDCFLTKDEIARGEMGCGEDCLNRLLMIEW